MTEPLYRDCDNCGELNIPEDATFLAWSDWDNCYKNLCRFCWTHADMEYV